MLIGAAAASLLIASVPDAVPPLVGEKLIPTMVDCWAFSVNGVDSDELTSNWLPVSESFETVTLRFEEVFFSVIEAVLEEPVGTIPNERLEVSDAKVLLLFSVPEWFWMPVPPPQPVKNRVALSMAMIGEGSFIMALMCLVIIRLQRGFKQMPESQMN